MANQQLLDYVKQQLQLNISSDEIRTTLLNTGWPEADVNEVLSAAGQVAAPTQSKNVSQPNTADITTSGQVSAQAQSSPATAPADKPQEQSPVANQPKVVTRDVFQTQNEPVFQPKQENFFDPTANGGVIGPVKPSHKNLIVMVSLGLACLIFAGLFIWMYMKNSDLKSQLLSATGAPAGGQSVDGAATNATGTPSGNQVEVLSQEKNNLQNKLDESSERTSLLNLELSFLVAPDPKAPTSTTLNQPVTISGTVSEKKAVYYLTTEDRVTISIKNSKDKDVITVLKPFLGGTVEFSGTYNVGSAIMTLEKINGKTPAEIIAEKAAEAAAAKAKAEAEAKAKAEAEAAARAALASSTPTSTPEVLATTTPPATTTANPIIDAPATTTPPAAPTSTPTTTPPTP